MSLDAKIAKNIEICIINNLPPRTHAVLIFCTGCHHAPIALYGIWSLHPVNLEYNWTYMKIYFCNSKTFVFQCKVPIQYKKGHVCHYAPAVSSSCLQLQNILKKLFIRHAKMRLESGLFYAEKNLSWNCRGDMYF